MKIIHSKHPHLWSDRPFRRQPCVELASWLANWHYCTVLHLLLSAPISWHFLVEHFHRLPGSRFKATVIDRLAAAACDVLQQGDEDRLAWEEAGWKRIQVERGFHLGRSDGWWEVGSALAWYPSLLQEEICNTVGDAETDKLYYRWEDANILLDRWNAYWLAADEDRLAWYLSLLYSIGRGPMDIVHREKRTSLYLSSLESLMQTRWWRQAGIIISM